MPVAIVRVTAFSDCQIREVNMKEEIVKTIKCAIYTRKSTDEGLEKEFNTLEAQREAG